MTDTQRIEELEIKLAHLERGLAELSDVVVRQQADIDRLTARNQRLIERLEELRTHGPPPGPEDELPPHY